MMKIFKKYILLIVMIISSTVTLFIFPDSGKNIFTFTGNTLINFIFMLAPVFVCVGLLDIWVEKKKMIKIMGGKSGLKGIVIAFLLGIVTAVPLYALLPIAGIMLKKGSKISNVLIFICSSASIRIPLLLFEISSLGLKFTIIRLLINIFVVILIAYIVDLLLTQNDKEKVYSIANKL